MSSLQEDQNFRSNQGNTESLTVEGALEGDVEMTNDRKVNPLPAVIDIHGDDIARRSWFPTCFHRGPVWFIKKYFFQGQSLNPSQAKAVAELPDDAPWYKQILVKHRRVVALLFPVTVNYFLWWSMAIKHNFFRYFIEKYFMTITMILGGLVAGMTSEGGGAVAFPVMTMAFGIKASIARDFSMMIQFTGMSGASFAILFMRIDIEWHAIIVCSLGAVFGLLIGLEKVDPLVSPQSKKMFFVSVWFSFAFALFLLNRYHKRKTFNKIQNVKAWKIVVLFFTGVVGGLCTAIAGGGVDICSFSVLTLLFRVSEKVATPTSVVLMATNSAIGVFWRHLILEAIEVETWEYLAVTAPIVFVMTPLGAILGSHFHRLVLASFVYILDTVALVSAFIIIRPLPPWLVGMSLGIIVFGFILFFLLTKAGQRLLQETESGQIDEECSSEISGQLEDEKYLADEKNLPLGSTSL